MSGRPKLILHTANNSARTEAILENAGHIKSLPIDGMVINIPQSFHLMQPADNVPAGGEVTPETLDLWLPQLAEFNVGMENYLVTFIDRPGDLFDDLAWGQVVENFQLLAEAAKEAGFKGLIFDNEEYNGQWDNFPEDWPGAVAEDLPLYQAQASLRGKQIMEAIDEVFPDGAFGVMHGPYTSVDGGDATPRAVLDQTGGPQNQELRGAFFTGLLEGKGPDQTLIDMGELYGARTPAALEASQDYRSEIVRNLIDWNVPSALLENWDELITISHMVSTDQFPRDGVTPESLEETLEAAFAHSEDAVFLYSTVGTGFNAEDLDWFRPGAVRSEWIDALAQAIADYEAAGDEDDTDENTFLGGEGNDRLVGTGDDDRLFGGAGNDVLRGGVGRDDLNGGDGRDRADYSGSDAGITVNLSLGEGYFGHADGDRMRDIEAVSGSRFSDLLVGNAENNFLIGGRGEDALYGNGGNDRLEGGTGGDTIAGGEGRDVASYRRSESGVEIDLTNGRAFGGDATGDILMGVENIEGSSFDDVLTGAHDDSILIGGAGNDVLSGNWGVDRLRGGAGDDTLSGGGDADIFVFRAETGGGRDVITDFQASEGDILRIELQQTGTRAQKLDELSFRQEGSHTIIIAADQTIVLEETELEGFDTSSILFF